MFPLLIFWQEPYIWRVVILLCPLGQQYLLQRRGFRGCPLKGVWQSPSWSPARDTTGETADWEVLLPRSWHPTTSMYTSTCTCTLTPWKKKKDYGCSVYMYIVVQGCVVMYSVQSEHWSATFSTECANNLLIDYNYYVDIMLLLKKLIILVWHCIYYSHVFCAVWVQENSTDQRCLAQKMYKSLKNF